MQYIAKLTREGGRWLIDFPDCPGCQTFGDTKEEALAMAADALEGWLETHLEHGDVPRARGRERGAAVWRSTSRLDWMSRSSCAGYATSSG